MYNRILVPIDGSPTSSQGLDEAIKLASLTGARLRLLHVVDEFAAAMGMSGYPPVTVDIMALLMEGGEQTLKNAKETVLRHNIAVDTVLVEGFAGRVCDLVAAEVSKWGADLVVLGSHGRRGVGRIVLGSDAEQIIRSSRVPVLVVRAPETAAAGELPPGTG